MKEPAVLPGLTLFASVEFVWKSLHSNKHLHLVKNTPPSAFNIHLRTSDFSISTATKKINICPVLFSFQIIFHPPPSFTASCCGPFYVVQHSLKKQYFECLWRAHANLDISQHAPPMTHQVYCKPLNLKHMGKEKNPSLHVHQAYNDEKEKPYYRKLT